MNFTDKKVMVTGGSRGIGRATALAFAEKGARVAVVFKDNHQAAQGTLDALPGKGHVAIAADLRDPAAAEKLIAQAVDALGGLDILVNNAGIFVPHRIDQVDYETWQRAWHDIMDINLHAIANLCYWAVHYMKDHNGGRIVNVSSRGAFRGEPEYPAYGASKAALNSFSQSLAQYVARHNIYVGVVAPGFVSTDMAKASLEGPDGEAILKQSPLGRVARPEEVAHGILFLASEGSEFMTGGILDINGASYLRT
jgi:NAD(P)-dependent dehydrogenase (short-subunit alcohol dehydrogenase family)